MGLILEALFIWFERAVSYGEAPPMNKTGKNFAPRSNYLDTVYFSEDQGDFFLRSRISLA